jgi:hypothetical protein
MSFCGSKTISRQPGAFDSSSCVTTERDGYDDAEFVDTNWLNNLVP